MSKAKRLKAKQVTKFKEKLETLRSYLSTWTAGTPAHKELDRRIKALEEEIFNLTKHPNQVE